MCFWCVGFNEIHRLQYERKLKSGQCRRLYLLQEFDHVKDIVDCKCCDMCYSVCVCVNYVLYNYYESIIADTGD